MAESLKHVILRLAEERAGATFSPTEAAMALGMDALDDLYRVLRTRGLQRA